MDDGLDLDGRVAVVTGAGWRPRSEPRAAVAEVLGIDTDEEQTA